MAVIEDGRGNAHGQRLNRRTGCRRARTRTERHISHRDNEQQRRKLLCGRDQGRPIHRLAFDRQHDNARRGCCEKRHRLAERHSVRGIDAHGHDAHFAAWQRIKKSVVAWLRRRGLAFVRQPVAIDDVPTDQLTFAVAGEAALDLRSRIVDAGRDQSDHSAAGVDAGREFGFGCRGLREADRCQRHSDDKGRQPRGAP